MSSGYVFSDASSSGDPNIIQNHHINFHEPNPEIYALGTSSSTAAMESIINGFQTPSKNLDSISTLQGYPSTPWNHHLLHIPCQGNNDQISPTQDGRLSLSLTSSKPSNIDHHGLHHSFDLTENDYSRFGPSSSRSVNIQHHPQVMQESLQIRSSRYLGPAQELLNQFCNLGVTQTDKNSPKTNKDDEINAMKTQALYALDLAQLQKRKTKLLQMLLEVERRYKHYCDQMKVVVQSFEAVAGDGAARVYSSMASKAMSRHFRCLKDGILSQIKATKNAMGEKINGGAVAGSSKGETPRLRLLDQTLRQQRALQQMNVMETHPWRPQRGLPERAVSVLRAWLFEHFLNPYPSDVDKHVLARQTGLSRGQVSNWFINARVRLWKPMVEEMYLQDLKESDHGGAGAPDPAAPDYPSNHNEDQKPAVNDHLMMRMDSDCLSTIINRDGKQRTKALGGDEGFGAVGNGNEYGSMPFDFSSSSYGHHATASYGGGGGGVSLTLGLHRNGGSGGVSLAFSPTSQSSLFYPREQLGDCQTVQFSGLGSENHSCFMI